MKNCSNVRVFKWHTKPDGTHDIQTKKNRLCKLNGLKRNGKPIKPNKAASSPARYLMFTLLNHKEIHNSIELNNEHLNIRTPEQRQLLLLLLILLL